MTSYITFLEIESSILTPLKKKDEESKLQGWRGKQETHTLKKERKKPWSERNGNDDKREKGKESV